MPFPQPFQPDSLCTFQRPGDVTPIELGNYDCWVRIDTNRGMRRLTVAARYVRNEAADPKFYTPAAVRAAAETYFNDLVAQMGGVIKFETRDQGGKDVPIFEADAAVDAGTVENPYTGLSETGMYLIDASFDDEGWRGYDMVFVFGTRQNQPEVANIPTFTLDSGGGAISLGSWDGYVVITNDNGERVYTVHAFYEGSDRAAAEAYAADLADSLKVRDFETVNGLSYPAPDAEIGTLANPDTSLSVADLYAIRLRHRDSGDNFYEIVITFRSATGIGGTDKLATWAAPCGGTQIDLGNQDSWVEPASDYDFSRFTITGVYRGSDYLTYFDTLLTSLGSTHSQEVVLPTARGRLLAYCRTPGCLRWDGQVFDNYYITGVEVEEVRRTPGQAFGTVVFRILIAKGNSD